MRLPANFCATLAFAALLLLHAPACGQTPVNFKIAFFGDQSLEPSAVAVLNLVRSEGAHAVLHSGDFDYTDAPQAWDAQIDAVLGANFPYFGCIGNHDTGRYWHPGGYQDLLEARMIRLGIPWDGDLGIRSWHVYGGILFVLTAPSISGSGHHLYIRDTLAASAAAWRVSSWHVNMRSMQVGGKHDEAGWDVYEASRRGGAIIATAHEHSYSRTHLMSSMQNQIIASTSNTLVLRKDDPATVGVDEGRSFVFVSGLGGRSIRDQNRNDPWWASIYTSNQNANHGALFGVFNLNGDPTLARFYFKSIDGLIVDDFYVRSPLPPPTSDVARARGDVLLTAELQPGNPVRGRLSVLYTLAQPQLVTLSVHDVRGRCCFTPFAERLHAAGVHHWDWDLREHRHAAGVYFLRLATPHGSRTLRAVVLE